VNPRRVLRISGLLLLVIAFMTLAPLGIAIADGVPRAILAYALGGTLMALTAWFMLRFGRRSEPVIERRDAFGIVALTWFALGIFGAIPFLIEGAVERPAEAFFEAVSGFTTTGATVIGDVEALSRATNLWRCLMHWIGGMGIVVLFVAVFPHLGIGARQLFMAESPGPLNEGLRPRIKQSALTLWWIYAAITGACALVYALGGMSTYEALCHAMSTLATGGFSTRARSIASFDSPLIEWSTCFFMLAAGLNFGLYDALLRGRARLAVRDSEARFFLILNVLIILLTFLLTMARHSSVEEALRKSTFQILAVTTTTGFSTDDFDTYPDIIRWILFLAMFMGGCTGSTAGGLKVFRVLVALKVVVKEVRLSVEPAAIMAIRVGTKALPSTIVGAILVFIVSFLVLFLTATSLLIAFGLDFVSASSAVVSCMSSVGIGLGRVGPTHDFGFISSPGLFVLSFIMIAGRLEIFALLAAFSPAAWRRS